MMKYAREVLKAVEKASEAGQALALGPGAVANLCLEIAWWRAKLEQIQQERLTWAMVCDCNCKACLNLDRLLRDVIETKIRTERSALNGE